MNAPPAFSRRDTEALERAFIESADGAGRPPPVHRQGTLIVRMWTVRSVPVALSSDALLRAVRLFQHYREGPPSIRLDDRQITWRDRQGIIFHLESGDGRTEIRVRVSRFLIRRGRMERWVRSAADRLRSVILLVADGASSPPRALEPGEDR